MLAGGQLDGEVGGAHPQLTERQGVHQAAGVAQEDRCREGELLGHPGQRGAQCRPHGEPGRPARQRHPVGEPAAVAEAGQQGRPAGTAEQVGARVDDPAGSDGIERQGGDPGERPHVDDVAGHGHDPVGTAGRLRQQRPRRAAVATGGPHDHPHRCPGLERGLVLDGAVGRRGVGERQGAHRDGQQHQQHGAHLAGQPAGELPAAPRRLEPAGLPGETGDLAGEHRQQPQAEHRQPGDDDGRRCGGQRVDRRGPGRVVATQLHDRERPETDEQHVEPRAR